MNLRLAECRAEAPLEALRRQLAETEYAMLSGMRDQRRARLRAHAYVLIRQLLKTLPSDTPVSYDPDGRPRVAGLPVDISISHTENMVAAGVVDSGYRIGVDIESLQQDIDVDAFLRFALNGSERGELERMAAFGWLPKEAVIGIWSAKEALCKSAGYPFRPGDLSLCWPESFQDATVSPSARLQAFLEERGLEPVRLSMSRDAGRVRTCAVLRAHAGG